MARIGVLDSTLASEQNIFDQLAKEKVAWKKVAGAPGAFPQAFR